MASRLGGRLGWINFAAVGIGRIVSRCFTIRTPLGPRSEERRLGDRPSQIDISVTRSLSALRKRRALAVRVPGAFVDIDKLGVGFSG
jgi:hypothetical protein